MNETNPLSYASPPPVHRGAVVVFWLAVASAFGFFLVVPPLVVLIVATGVHFHVGNDPRRQGTKYAHRAVAISFLATVTGFLFVVLTPHHHPRELSNRRVCAANLRSVMQAI